MTQNLPKDAWIWLALPAAICAWSLTHYFANRADSRLHAMQTAAPALLAPLPGVRTPAARAKSLVETIQANKIAAAEKSSLVSMVLNAMKEADSKGGKLSTLAEVELKKRLSAASLDELAALLPELDASSASTSMREKVEKLVYQHMAERDMRKALELGLTRIYSAPRDVRNCIYDLFMNWCWNHQQQAEPWLDQQIASGMFDSQSGDGMNRPRNGFEERVWKSLLAHGNFEGFAKRFENTPEKVRHDVMEYFNIGVVKPQHEVELSNLLRKYLDEETLLNPFTGLVCSRAMKSGYQAASLTLEHVVLTPKELSNAVKASARSIVYDVSCDGPVTLEPFNEARAWTEKHTPAIVDTFTGELLVLVAETRKVGKFEESMKLLESLKNDPARDVIVSSFIHELNLDSIKRQSLPLVDTINDPVLREQTRAYLKQSIEP